MKLYVESNFVLEVVLEQQEATACEGLMSRAEAEMISLQIPAYALLEPAETLTRRTKHWDELGQNVRKELVQFERTANLAQEARQFSELMVKATHAATSRFEELRQRLLRIARVLPCDENTLRDAERVRRQYKLKLPDAVMLAAVLSDLDGSDALFINRNTKDFADPDIRRELRDGGCEFLGSFEAAHRRLTRS